VSILLFKQFKPNYQGGLIMANSDSYIETEKEREEGHVDTREENFECENKDPHLGCDPGIDVAG
jgi:hypothetical protein